MTIQWHLGRRIPSSVGGCRRWRRSIGSWSAGVWWCLPRRSVRSRRGAGSRRRHRTSGGRSTRWTGSDRHRRGEGVQRARRPLQGGHRFPGGARRRRRAGVDHVLPGSATLGVPRRVPVRQRAVLLRAPARLRGAVRSPPARRRSATLHRAALPPPDHRQGRTVPADPQAVAAPPTPRRRPRRVTGPARRVLPLLQRRTTPSRHRSADPDQSLAGQPRRHPPPSPSPPRSARPDPATARSPTKASPSSTSWQSTSAPNGPAATPPSSSTAPTPPCSSPINSCATSASTPPAATSPPGDHAADPDDPAGYPPDCHPCPATTCHPSS